MLTHMEKLLVRELWSKLFDAMHDTSHDLDGAEFGSVSGPIKFAMHDAWKEFCDAHGIDPYPKQATYRS